MKDVKHIIINNHFRDGLAERAMATHTYGIDNNYIIRSTNPYIDITMMLQQQLVEPATVYSENVWSRLAEKGLAMIGSRELSIHIR